MSTVKSILKSKGDALFTIDADAPVYQALQKMAENDVGSLVVTRDGKFFGIFTERDYARNVVLKGKFSKDTFVMDVIEPNTTCVSPDDTIETCMALMTTKRTRHLPVLHNEELVGIVSIGDIIKKIISDKDLAIKELEGYVFGRYGA